MQWREDIHSWITGWWSLPQKFHPPIGSWGFKTSSYCGKRHGMLFLRSWQTGLSIHTAPQSAGVSLAISALPYVDDLLSERSLKEKGYFHPTKVTKLVEKVRRQDGQLLSERENMGLIGILSTQLLDEMFIKNFPYHPIVEPEECQSLRLQNKNMMQIYLPPVLSLRRDHYETQSRIV